MGRLLNDQTFKTNAMRMLLLSRQAGGPRKVCEFVESAYIHYSAEEKMVTRGDGFKMREATHLVPLDYIEISTPIHFTKSWCCRCWLFILIIYVLIDGWVGIIPGANNGVWRYNSPVKTA